MGVDAETDNNINCHVIHVNIVLPDGGFRACGPYWTVVYDSTCDAKIYVARSSTKKMHVVSHAANAFVYKIMMFSGHGLQEEPWW